MIYGVEGSLLKTGVCREGRKLKFLQWVKCYVAHVGRPLDKFGAACGAAPRTVAQLSLRQGLAIERLDSAIR